MEDFSVKDWLGEDNNLGISIWENKYRHNNESFGEWLNRVSAGDKEVKELILTQKFLPGGRILANRGLANEGTKITYSNCYVISPPEDNIESIYETTKKLARTYSYGGGCGISISKLSPRNAKIRNAAKTTSGAVSFMDTFSQVTEQIGQMGRRGALMISIDCTHPDLEEFIDIKKDLNKVTKANISIQLSDEFMKAVRDGRPFKLYFKREETEEVIEKEVDARKLFMKIAENNWEMGEPGCLFWDTISEYNLLSEYDDFSYAGVNPCAEEPLPAGGSCLLGSLNLSRFVEINSMENPKFNFEDFGKAIDISVKYLNDVMMEGLPLHPLAEQRETVNDWRQIGLGIFGLADTLIHMHLAYGSTAAIEFCDKLGDFLAKRAIIASTKVAKTQGVFPKYNEEKILNSYFVLRHRCKEVDDAIKENGLANSQILTIAPTGSLSTMLGVSGGIEPIFASNYTRKTESLEGKDTYFKVYTPIYQRYMDYYGIKDENELPSWFITAPKIDYTDRVKMQAIWQDHIDASISSTVNLPNEATPQEIFDLYLMAWSKGLKGITVFRDGCARAGILTNNNGKDKQELDKKSHQLQRGDIIAVDDNVIGLKRKINTGCGALHVNAYFDKNTGLLLETFFSKGSGGGCERSLDGLSRMISLACRGGIYIEDIIDQLNSVAVCPAYFSAIQKGKASPGTNCPGAIGRALLDMYNEMQDWIWDKDNGTITINNVSDEVPTVQVITNKCPDCGEPLIHEGGCVQCPNCGWSRCN